MGNDDEDDPEVPPFGSGRDTQRRYYHYDGTFTFSWRRLLVFLGPSWLMSIAYIVAWDAGASTTVSAVKWSLLALFVAVYVGFVGWLCWDFARHNVWTVAKEESGTSGQVQLGHDAHET